MSSFDLFSFMGIEAPQPKTEEKKEKPKKASSKSKSAAAKEVEYPLPCTIYIPYVGIVEITVADKKSLKESELKAELLKRQSWLPAAKDLVLEKKGDVVITYFSSACVIRKGEIGGLKEGASIYMGNVDISIEEATVDALNEQLKGNFEAFKGLDFGFIINNGKTGVIPVIISDEYSDDEDDEESEENTTPTVLYTVEGGEVSLTDTSEEGIRSQLDTRVPYKLYLGENAFIASVGTSIKSVATSTKKTTFDISSGEVTLSLVWHKIVLKPEMFNGKTEVEPEDLCLYLITQGYPEYSKDRTSFEYISKDDKATIVAVLKSSTKGAL